MKKKLPAIITVITLMLAMFSFIASAAPADALYYADFNNGPMAEPEQSMQATDAGGSLYVNDGPIRAEAEIVDGAIKLTLGSSGYYGINNTQCAFRDLEGNLTSYKYLVLRMRGEYGTENTPGAGGLMMSIGGGDGSHMGTFLSTASGDLQPFLDPEGCYMPLITTEYQDFVIALTESNVRVNPGRLVSGLNFNNSSGNITIYIDEIYLTSEIPESFVSSGNKADASSGGSESITQEGTNSVDESIIGSVTSPGGTSTVAENIVVSAGSGSSVLTTAVIIVLLVLIIVNLAVLVLIISRFAGNKKTDQDSGK